MPRAARTAAALLPLGLLVVLLFSCQGGAPRGSASALATSAPEGGPIGRASFEDEPSIRVRIFRGMPSLEVGAEHPLIVSSPATGETRALVPPVSIEASEGGVVARAVGTEIRAPAGGHLELIESSDAIYRVGPDADESSIRVAGRLAVHPVRDGSRLDGVLELPIERYLPGVLAAELIPGWEMAAFEAQAIAARSYALHERSRSRASGRRFDVESTTLDQVFEGETSNTRAIDAVERTRGQTLLAPDGLLLRAYYSSTCGGRPATASSVWPSEGELSFNKTAPLRGRVRDCPCDESPLYRWERTRGREEIRARLRAWGASAGHDLRRVGRVLSLEVERTSVTGRPERFKIIDDAGAVYRVSSENLRVAMNTTAPGQPAITRQTRVPSGDLEATVASGRVVLRGRGFGHGVGLCQFGAQGYAEQGHSAERMLRRFYPGARIERLYR
ncbi:MAG: SpoIID/LytB domain-containing protein [Planctomycetota bacterium]